MTTAAIGPDLKPAWTAPKLSALTTVARVAGGYEIGISEDATYILAS